MSRALNSATGVVALCALVTTASIVKRNMGPIVVDPPPIDNAPVAVRDWEPMALGGTRFGAVDPLVTITQFSDFQCPYCRRLFVTLAHVRDSFPEMVGLSYRHFPLDNIHPYARKAAHASECAARVGKFEQFHDELYARQDSIGKISWGEFAVRSGVGDTVGFLGCMDDPVVQARVRSDEEVGRQLGVRGTPTVLVNGWRLKAAPTFTRIDSIIRAAVKTHR